MLSNPQDVKLEVQSKFDTLIASFNDLERTLSKHRNTVSDSFTKKELQQIIYSLARYSSSIEETIQYDCMAKWDPSNYSC